MEEIAFHCVRCGTRMTAPESRAGTESECPHCLRHVLIPPIEGSGATAAGPATLPMAQARILQIQGESEKMRGERERARGDARRAIDEVASLQARVGELQRGVQSAEMTRALVERKLADARARCNRLESELLEAQAVSRETALELRRARAEIHRLRYTFRGDTPPED